MALVTIAVTAYLAQVGWSYYVSPLEEWFYHPQCDWFKASGAMGHGLGIVGTLLILIGVVLTGGLFMLSVGTYLGGVWANESWGRYWGWDAKETWALVSILVYAFILHMRLIPKLAGALAFNVANLVGLASVIMTYYGVNYYLSGLHSYAAGDPVPVPSWVYASVAAAVVVSALAARKVRQFKF